MVYTYTLLADFAVIYLCDIDEVPEFNTMYELYDPMTIMFFYRNKHMMCDFGTGNNNKLNWVLEDKQELIDIIETIYKGAKKGRGLVVSPKGKAIPCVNRFTICCVTIWLTALKITLLDTGTEMYVRCLLGGKCPGVENEKGLFREARILV